MQKTMRVDVDRGGTRVVVTHVVTNSTCWPVKVAPWAITVVATDGTAVVPQPPFRSHADSFLPARQLVQWSYSDFSDARWRIGSRLIALTPDPERRAAQKIGVANEAGWSALLCADCTFVKYAERQLAAEYPDLGCNTELFTAGDYLEMETLAPLRLLEPGESSEHIEEWYIGPALDAGLGDDGQLEAIQRLLDGSSPHPPL